MFLSALQQSSTVLYSYYLPVLYSTVQVACISQKDSVPPLIIELGDKKNLFQNYSDSESIEYRLIFGTPNMYSDLRQQEFLRGV